MNPPSGNPFKPGFSAAPEPVSPVEIAHKNPTAEGLAENLPVQVGNGVAQNNIIICDLDSHLVKLRGLLPSRERATAITKLQEAIFWLREDNCRLTAKPI